MHSTERVVCIPSTTMHARRRRWDFTWDSTVVYPLRIEYLAPTTGEAEPALTIMWRLSPSSPFMVVPAASLSASVSSPELQRQRMQDDLGRGFNTWWRPSATTHACSPSLVFGQLCFFPRLTCHNVTMRTLRNTHALIYQIGPLSHHHATCTFRLLSIVGIHLMQAFNRMFCPN